MKTSPPPSAALSLGLGIRFDPALPGILAEHPLPRLGRLGRSLRRRLASPPVHALLADARGVWAWAPGDCYAPATYHGELQDWIRAHAGCEMKLWVADALTQDLEDADTARLGDDRSLRRHARDAFVTRHGAAAAAWPLATWQDSAIPGAIALSGIDLAALERHGQRHGVRIRAVAPWWHHAYVEARRCVPGLARMASARVGVVQGRYTTWISVSGGAMSGVRRQVLEQPCVDALRAAMADAAPAEAGMTVLLGHGLDDGHRTDATGAFVLGRLDGEQPPQWLRPSTQAETH